MGRHASWLVLPGLTVSAFLLARVLQGTPQGGPPPGGLTTPADQSAALRNHARGDVAALARVVQAVAQVRAAGPGDPPPVPAVDVPSELTPFQDAILRAPQPAGETRNALIRALQRVDLRPCFQGTGLVGSATARFRWNVQTTATEGTAGDGKLVEVTEGTALPEPLTSCIEARLARVGRITPEPGRTLLPAFSGAVDVPMRFANLDFGRLPGQLPLE